MREECRLKRLFIDAAYRDSLIENFRWKHSKHADAAREFSGIPLSFYLLTIRRAYIYGIVNEIWKKESGAILCSFESSTSCYCRRNLVSILDQLGQ